MALAAQRSSGLQQSLPGEGHEVPSHVSSIDPDLLLDVYDDEITRALNLFGIAGIPALRENQAPAIASALGGQDIVLSLATGAGKSLCFQIPAIVLSQRREVTIVLQPTLEIISNQVHALAQHKIDVVTLSSLTSHEEKSELAERIHNGYRPALLYTTVESFFGTYSHVFSTLHGQGALARVVVDEAHTAIHWEEFKPAMKHLTHLRQLYAGVPVTVATASITPADRTTLLARLSPSITPWRIISASVDRPNLYLSVRHLHSTYHNVRMKEVLDFLAEVAGLDSVSRHSGIIYCATAQRCDDVVKTLNNVYGMHYAKSFYGESHGMDQDARSKVMRDWMGGDVKVLVATIAFGMGVDKADVRFVVHYDLPKTLENYAQEVGRAGRDGAPAFCMLIYSWQDVQRTLFYLNLSDPSATERALAKLATYFGQGPFSALVACRTACDNCRCATSLTELNVTGIARALVSMFRSQALSDGARSFKRIVNTVRGSRSKDILPHAATLDQYGKARNCSLEVVQLVFSTLLAHNVLCVRSTARDLNGRPRWSSTDLKFTVGTRALEAELFEDTARGRQMLIRTFGANQSNRVQSTVNLGDRTPLVIDLTHEEDEEETEDTERIMLSAKARGKRPERAASWQLRPGSSLPHTPSIAQDLLSPLLSLPSSACTQVSSMKRKTVRFDDEYEETSAQIGFPVPYPPRKRHASAGASVKQSDNRHGHSYIPLQSGCVLAHDHDSGTSTEIIELGSSEDEDVSHAPLDIPGTRPSSENVRLLKKGREVAFVQYRMRDNLQDEYGVLSDRALVALAVDRPIDPIAFVNTLRKCGVHRPEEKWTLYGAHFRALIGSRQFRDVSGL